jgi:P pilus assembly chaperone PapD
LCASNAKADIVISGTRIVYTQSSKDVVVNLDNHGTKPLLVQTWLDDGRDGVNPQELKLPFIITPPVSRIDPKKGSPCELPTRVHRYLRIVNPVLVQRSGNSAKIQKCG